MVATRYRVIITDANATIRVYDRMPVILVPADARRWSEPQLLPAELFISYPAAAIAGRQVIDAAKNSRIEPSLEMAEPAAVHL